MKTFFRSAALALLILVGWQTAVYAAPLPAASSAVTVSPAIQNVTLARNQDSASYTSSISNDTAQALRVQVVTRDFTSLSDNGGLAFVASGTSATHGIASSLSVDTPLFVLQPHTSRSVKVTIVNATKLAGGGHYGAITYQLSPLQLNNTPGNKVHWHPSCHGCYECRFRLDFTADESFIHSIAYHNFPSRASGYLQPAAVLSL